MSAMPTSEDSLRDALRAVGRRMRLRVLVRRLTLCIALGLIPSLLYLAALRAGLLFRLGWDLWPAWSALLPVVAGVAAGLAWGYGRRVSDFEAAQLADERLGLRERLGSAVALANAPASSVGPLLGAVLEDASRHATGVHARQVVPKLLPRRAWWTPALGCAVVGLWLVPSQNWFVNPKQLAEREAVREEGNRLLDLAREIRTSSEASDLADSERIARRLEALGRNLQGGRMSRREAMKALAQLTDELRTTHQELAKKARQEQVKAGVERAKERGTATAEMASMLQALGSGDVEGAKRQLADLQAKLESGQLNAEDKARLAQDLKTIGESLEGTSADGSAQAMQQAAESLEQGDEQAAQQQLSQAESELGEGELAEMQRLESLAKELEFSEDRVANPPSLGRQEGNNSPPPEENQEPPQDEQPQPEERMRQQGDRMSSVAEGVEKQAQQSGSQRSQELAQKAQELGERMSSGATSPEQAEREKEQLRQEAEQARQESLSKDGAGEVGKALSELKGEGLDSQLGTRMAEQMAQNPEAASKMMEQAAKQLENMSPEQVEQLAQDLGKMADKLDGTAAQDMAKQMEQAANSMSQEDRERAAQQLEQMAEQLANSDWAKRLAESGQLQRLAQELGGQGSGGADEGIQEGQPGGGVAAMTESELREQFRGRNTRVRGRAGDVDDTPYMEVTGVGPSGEAATPYFEVRPPSGQQIQDALDRENIPAVSRPLVQDYFRSLRGQ